MRLHIRMALILLLLLLYILPIQAFSQSLDPAPASYTLDGDNIFFSTSETGDSTFTADGNVRLTYTLESETWVLSADGVDLAGRLENNNDFIPELASAVGNIHLDNGSINVTTPGKLVVDFVNHTAVSDSESVTVEFTEGTITTGNIEIIQKQPEQADSEETVTLNTIGHTIAEVNLADTGIFDRLYSNESQSMFGSLTFDFAMIKMETENITVVLENGEPASLECGYPTTVTTAQNTLVMPSCSMSFDPPTLSGNDGVELTVGEDTRVEADFLNLVYPEEGGMVVEFIGLCAPPSPEITPVPDQRVRIINPAGIFTADMISITIDPEGMRRIHATGCASLEIPMESIRGIVEESG